MRTNARRGAHALTMVVLTAAVGLSGRVEAQQSGLFPLAPIRRQRVPCDQEDPTYKIYKSQYFGYHPTCWNPFPAGWGCPSTQAPNRQKSIDEIKPFSNRESGEMMDDEDGAEPLPRRRNEPLPLPGNMDENLFDTNTPATGAIPGAPAQPGGEVRPRTQPAERPFDLNPRGAMRRPSRSRSRARTGPSPTPDDAPELAAPDRTAARGSEDRRARAADAEEGTGPLLGLADSDIVRSDTASVDTPTADAPAADAPAADVATTPTPAAPPRRRLFGNLFSALGGNSTPR